jgi:hypothetical protein
MKNVFGQGMFREEVEGVIGLGVKRAGEMAQCDLVILGVGKDGMRVDVIRRTIRYQMITAIYFVQSYKGKNKDYYSERNPHMLLG